MRFTSVQGLYGLLYLSNTVLAVPRELLVERQACNADLCNRALRGATSASADCSSFFKATVYGCSSTSVSTVIVSASPSTVTQTTTSTTRPPPTVVVQSATSTLSQVTTTTSTPISTVLVTATFTFTAYSTTTVSVRPTGPNGPMKRQATCSSSTVMPSNLPSYASRCSSTARYSSACSCLGVAKSTITSSAGTISTTTSTVTPVVTVTTTVISSVKPPGVVSKTTVTTTKSVTVVVTASTTLLTTSTTGTITTTSAVQTIAPTSKPFKLILPGGRYVGSITTGSADNTSYVITPVSDSASAITLFIDEQGRAIQPNPTDRYHATLAVYQTTGDDIIHYHPNNGTPLYCQLSNPQSNSGAFTCNIGDQRFFNLCGQYIYISNYRKPGPTCASIDLQAIPV